MKMGQAIPPHSIGLFGGSFNPVHNGHVGLAELVQQTCGFETLWVIPSGTPPHKKAFEISAEHRLEMVRLAFRDVKEAKVSDYELKKSEPGYAIETIQHFVSTTPGHAVYFIVGADTFYDLPQWWRFPEVMEACSYVVTGRKNDSNASKLLAKLGELESAGLLKKVEAKRNVFYAQYESRSGTQVCLLETAPPAVSSTELRDRLAKGIAVDSLVPDAVARYLKTHGLYGTRKV